ncbi:hypothetical protein PULV_a2874 [Pseudoalteromonas ulvae UL12]|nr:hypothetical protein [Pseudoalteromonas ulvae UL12]
MQILTLAYCLRGKNKTQANIENTQAGGLKSLRTDYKVGL